METGGWRDEARVGRSVKRGEWRQKHGGRRVEAHVGRRVKARETDMGVCACEVDLWKERGVYLKVCVCEGRKERGVCKG